MSRTDIWCGWLPMPDILKTLLSARCSSMTVWTLPGAISKEHPEAHYSNLPFIMNYCLSRLDKDNYCDSVSIRNARKVEFLLDNGWEINDSGISDGNRTGYYSESHLTALCIAIRNRDIRTANLLIERGADVNLGNPLAIAVNEGDRKRVQMLLSNEGRR